MKQIIVFHQRGCPACHDYLPRFKRRAVKYRPFVHIQTPNLSRPDQAVQDAANRFKINAVPTTLVLDEKDKILKRTEGAVADKDIVALLEFAAK